jgi:hypothetical protein
MNAEIGCSNCYVAWRIMLIFIFLSLWKCKHAPHTQQQCRRKFHVTRIGCAHMMGNLLFGMATSDSVIINLHNMSNKYTKKMLLGRFSLVDDIFYLAK